MDLAFISAPDMVVVMAVALVVFGPKRLPDVARQLGSLMREMRKMVGQVTGAMDDVHEEFRPFIHDVEPAPPSNRISSLPPGELMKPYDQRETPPAPPADAEPLSLSTLPTSHGEPKAEEPVVERSAKP
jgi:TatA/E family protein of Tat protein translocase